MAGTSKQAGRSSQPATCRQCGVPLTLTLLERKPPKLVAVALANKLARVAWKLMITGEAYAVKPVSTGAASAL